MEYKNNFSKFHNRIMLLMYCLFESNTNETMLNRIGNYVNVRQIF
jgi:hypothetical protein